MIAKHFPLRSRDSKSSFVYDTGRFQCLLSWRNGSVQSSDVRRQCLLQQLLLSKCRCVLLSLRSITSSCTSISVHVFTELSFQRRHFESINVALFALPTAILEHSKRLSLFEYLATDTTDQRFRVSLTGLYPPLYVIYPCVFPMDNKLSVLLV